MDDSRFDDLIKKLDGFATRRVALKAAGVSGLAAALAALAFDAEAKKKKKKCKKPKVKCGKKCCAAGLRCVNGRCAAPPPPEECDITKSAALWILEADCTITRTIEVPNGVTFDGDGKTITMTGQVNAYTAIVALGGAAAGILVQGGNAGVRDLHVVGGNLQSPQNRGFNALAFRSTSGEIEGVTVTGIRPVAPFPGGVGIVVLRDSAASQSVSLEGVNVSDVSATAVSISAVTATLDDVDLEADRDALVLVDSTATISDSVLEAGSTGISAVGSTLTAEGNTVRVEGTAFNLSQTIAATVKGNTIQGTQAIEAVLAANGGAVTIEDNTVTGHRIGFAFISSEDFGEDGADDPVDATVTGNTITGTGQAVGFGVAYARLATGELSGNTISNFTDGDPGETSCGISVFDDAGDVTIGANTFPDPPGNEQDVCDNRP